MNCGKIWAPDYFEFRCNFTASTSAVGVTSHTVKAETHYRTILDEYAVGISIIGVYDPSSAWDIAVTVPDHSLSRTVVANPTMDVNVRVYYTLYATKTYWILKDTEVKVYIDGVLTDTWTIGDISSIFVGKQPSAIPLIGIPPDCLSLPDVPVPRRNTDPDNVFDTWSGTWGWKYVVDGVDVTFPISIYPGSVPSGCSLTAPVMPTLSGTDTWTVTSSGSATVDVNTTDATILTNYTRIVIIPDLTRRWRRYGTDFRMFVGRASLPSATFEQVSSCTSGGVTVPFENNLTLIPERPFIKSVVGQSAHPFEDALNDRVYCISTIEGIRTHLVTSGGSIFFDDYVRADRLKLPGAGAAPSGSIGNYAAAFNPETRYWDYLCNPHWSHASVFKDWDFNRVLYWQLGRQQWMDDPDLPESEQRETRNNVVLDAIRSCGALAGWWDLLIYETFRQLGASRFQVVDVTPRTAYTYDSSSSALWTLTGCTGAFGATIVLTSSGGATTLQADLDLQTFGSADELWSQIADQVYVDWVTTNISSIDWSLVDQQGNVHPLAESKAAYVDKPKNLAQNYACSLGIDNGMGYLTDIWTDDLGSGVSATTMADKEQVHNFQLAGDRTYTKLRADITLTAAGTCTLQYPRFRTRISAASRKPDLVWESGQCAVVCWPDGAAARFGSERWTNPSTGALLTTPTVVAAGNQQSIVDALCWERTVLEGIERSTNLLTQLGNLFDSVEGNAVEDAAFDTAGVILPLPTMTRFQIAAMNLDAECPPLLMCPRKERDSDWAETGDYCLDVWSWAPEPQRYVAAGPAPLHVFDTADAQWTSVEGGHATGYTVTYHNHAITNTESGFKGKAGSVELGTMKPFRGGYIVHGLGTSTSASGPFNFQDTRGRYKRVNTNSSGIEFNGVDWTRPYPGFDRTVQVTSDPTDTGPRIFEDPLIRRLFIVFARE